MLGNRIFGRKTKKGWLGILLSLAMLISLVSAVVPATPAAAATNSVTVNKYGPYGNLLGTQTVDYTWMEANLPVYGDGVTHYYMHGPTFEDSSFDALWDPIEIVNIDSRDYGAAKGTDLKDLCNLVGGAAPGDTIQVKAPDNFNKWFDYEDIYNPEPEQGKMIVAWYNATFGGYVPTYGTGMRLILFAETLNPEGKYVFGDWDMHETLPASRWHYFYDGNYWPSSSGLSVQTVSSINIYQPNLISCDASGNAKDNFTVDETVYVKGLGLSANTGYNLWIQDEPVLPSPLNALDRPSGNPYVLSTANDASGAQEIVTTDGNGDFGPVAIWAIDPGADSGKYDIVADNQASGAGTYGSNDYIDNPGWQGFSIVGLPHPPVAVFTSNVQAGYTPLTVHFTDQSTKSPTSWAWDFNNDGTVDCIDQNPSYTYTVVGTYSVKLTVTNDFGSDDELKTEYINVIEAVAPVAGFISDFQTGTTPLTVNYNDQSTKSPTSWAWDFNNDGTVDSNEQNPSYTYMVVGTYSVKLTASNAIGSDDEVKTNYITVSEPSFPVPLWGPYLTSTTTTNTTVNIKAYPATTATVEYATETYFLAHNAYNMSATDGTSTEMHHIQLEGLNAGTVYHYRVVYDTKTTADFQFSTFPESGPFTFVVYSDSQDQLPLFSQGKRHKLVADAIAAEEDISFVLHNGDLVNNGDNPQDWNRFFDAGRNMLAGNTLYPALGNHEDWSPLYFDTFGVAPYYSFSCGDGHFVVLDSTNMSTIDAQSTWLTSDLSSNDKTWNFTSFHHAGYTSESSHIGRNASLLDAWEPIFIANGIDAVWNGDVHVYERYIENGITYTVIGTGGGPSYTLSETKYNGYQNSLEHSLAYIKVTVDPATFIATAQVIRVADVSEDNSQVVIVYPAGAVYDTFVLQKTHTITASAGPYGNINPSGAVSVPHSGNQTFIITPDANYHIADVLVDGVSVGAVTSYTFTNVVSDHTFAATFNIRMAIGIEDMSVTFTWDKPKKEDRINIDGILALPEDGTYNLSADNVTIDIDGVVISISAGSFKKEGKKEKYRYATKEDKMTVILDFEKGKWSLAARDIDASAINSYDGVTIELTIGDMQGTLTINMRIDSLSF